MYYTFSVINLIQHNKKIKDSPCCLIVFSLPLDVRIFLITSMRECERATVWASPRPRGGRERGGGARACSPLHCTVAVTDTLCSGSAYDRVTTTAHHNSAAQMSTWQPLHGKVARSKWVLDHRCYTTVSVRMTSTAHHGSLSKTSSWPPLHTYAQTYSTFLPRPSMNRRALQCKQVHDYHCEVQWQEGVCDDQDNANKATTAQYNIRLIVKEMGACIATLNFSTCLLYWNETLYINPINNVILYKSCIAHIIV